MSDIPTDVIEAEFTESTKNTENLPVEVSDQSAPPPAIYEESDVQEDLEEARQTYKELVSKGKEGLDIAFRILEGSEHPRAVETFSGLMKSIAEVSKSMVELQQTKKEIAEPKPTEPQQSGSTNTQNNIFCGSTDDVLKLINGE